MKNDLSDTHTCNQVYVSGTAKSNESKKPAIGNKEHKHEQKLESWVY